MPLREPQSFPKVAFLLLSMLALSGCRSKPNSVKTVVSPTKDVFYTVEDFNGEGPLSSGSTDVYAHLNTGTGSDRQLVLRGLYLRVQVAWIDQEDVSLCLAGGLTSEYHNEVTLNAGQASRTIHNHLKENC